MRKDNAIKIQYASKYASIANYWKKWIEKPKDFKIECRSRKREAEKAFSKKLLKLVKKNTVHF
jgi:hypothetical protein